jgi:hypothetical protein
MDNKNSGENVIIFYYCCHLCAVPHISTVSGGWGLPPLPFTLKSYLFVYPCIVVL